MDDIDKSIDDYIMGTYDPNSPFNRDDSDWEKWYDEVDFEEMMDYLKLDASDYGEYCALSGREVDNVDNQEAFVEEKENELYEYFITNVRDER